MIQTLIDMVRNLKSKVSSMVNRGYVTNINDSENVQKIQIQMEGREVKSGMPAVTQFGFHSAPPVGSESINLFQDGNRSNGVSVIVFNREHKPSLNDGESQAYDAFGQYIKLGNNNKITYKANTLHSFESPLDTDEYYKVDNIKVVGNQQLHIPDATLETLLPTVNLILAAMRAHGLIASS